ncbi:MAG: radical SAM protein [Armatimonadetes bacterium]|nr:radical SAM protein [Armatimonadota bacterium]
MKALARYVAGYVLDFFRQRVDADDFRGDAVQHLLVGPGLDDASLSALRRLFPAAEFHSFGPRTGLWPLRRLRADAVCIAMTGGRLRERLLALLSGARHTLLLPSPDYIYRLGLRRGPAALLWALIDRFLLAPIALLWLGLVGAAMYATGQVRRAASVERGRAPWRPRRLLLIRLMPTTTFVALLRRLRTLFPEVHLTALLASDADRETVRAAADDVITPRTGGLFAIIRRIRTARFDTVILAGGADYGLRPSYLKAALLARLAPGADRRQWELGDTLPGAPLGRALGHALLARRTDANRTPGLVRRIALRRSYVREPSRGPAMAQIGLTKACNYHCLFCPFHSPAAEKGHRDADLPRLSPEMFARLLRDLRTMGTRAVDICGDGEPLMHRRALDMIALARDLGFDVTLATNAALLTDARARQLVDLGVRRMHVSFNAATDDVYERIHPGAPPGTRRTIIQRLRDMAGYAEAHCLRPVDVEFSAVLNRLNMHQIPQMVDAAREARARWFMLILMGPVEGAEDLLPRPEDWILIQSDIDRAAARARQWGIETNLDAIRPGATASGTRSVYEIIPCYIGHEYALITADGNVMFCCQCTHPLGNLNADSFRRIWYSEAYRQARTQARQLPRTRERLPGCECFTACSHVVVNLDVYRRLRGERALRSVM